MRKYENCFNIRARKFHFLKYKEFFLVFWPLTEKVHRSRKIYYFYSDRLNLNYHDQNCLTFSKLHHALDIYKKSEISDYVYFIWSWSRFRFFYVKSWFLCNTNRDCFCHINDAMLIFLFSNKLDENKALARTFIRGLSETFTKTLRLNVLTLLSVAYCT